MGMVTVLNNEAAEYYEADKETGKWKQLGPDGQSEPFEEKLREIAAVTLEGHPPISDVQLAPIAEFYGIDVKNVSFTHVACFKYATEAAKGDMSAFNMLVGFAGTAAPARRKKS